MKVNNDNKLVILSGIAPCKSGVGRLIEEIQKKNSEEYLKIYTKRISVGVREAYEKKGVFSAFGKMWKKLTAAFNFIWVSYFLKNKKIVFIHPQTAGYSTLRRIVEKNEVYFYIMDNSFFCLRSYNFHPIKKKECLMCLKGFNGDEKICEPWPVKQRKNKLKKDINWLRENSKKIKFLAQCDSQEKLLKASFGNINCQVVGMSSESEETAVNESNIEEDLIVFHGATNLAKGIEYFVKLADKIPEEIFFIPDEKENVERAIKRKICAKNIIFIRCDWESGLREKVMRAKVTINPSLWSAPIEGALLKSLKYGRRVVCVESEYGFSKELRIKNLYTLSTDIDLAIKELREIINMKVCEKKDMSLIEKIKKGKYGRSFQDFIDENK